MLGSGIGVLQHYLHCCVVSVHHNRRKWLKWEMTQTTSRVSSFRSGYSVCIGNRVQLIIGVLLAQDCAKSMCRGISLQNVLLIEVGIVQDRGGCEQLLQLLECCLRLLSPQPLEVSLGEVVQWGSNPGKVTNECSIVQSQAKEAPDLITFCGGGNSPKDSTSLRLIFKGISGNTMSQVLQLNTGKVTFGGFQLQPDVHWSVDHDSEMFYVIVQGTGVNENNRLGTLRQTLDHWPDLGQQAPSASISGILHICQAKWHDTKFVQALWHHKCCVLLG